MRARAFPGLAVPVLALLAALAGPLPPGGRATAQSIDLDVRLVVRPHPGRVELSCVVSNRGSVPAYDVAAELYGDPPDVRPAAGALAPGDSAVVTWERSPDVWRGAMRQVAAVRVRYRDASDVWAGAVVASGAPVHARVRGARWPYDSEVALRWSEGELGRSGTVVWWGPAEFEVRGPPAWRADGDSVAVTGRVDATVDITGWRTSVFALLFPGDGRAGAAVRVPVDARSMRALWRPDVPLLGGWTAAVLLGWAGLGLIARGRGGRRPRASGGGDGVEAAGMLRTLPGTTLVLVLGLVALTLVPPGLVALRTTPAGGDYASHIVALDYLARELLPSGSVVGWSQEQYGGFPVFLFYFPLVFLLAAGVAVAVPLTVAMKLASLAGPALLPAAWFLALRWLGAPPAASWLGAAASLPFLLLEEQTVFGGNLASTLAGEFAYGLGYPLAWLAMAAAWRTRDAPRGWWPVPVLLALTGLAHGYTLVAAAVGVGLLVLDPATWRSRAWTVARAGILAFGLLAWWLVPLLANAPWVNSFRERWVLGSFAEFLAPVLWPAVAVVAFGLLRRAPAPLLGRRGAGGQGPRRIAPRTDGALAESPPATDPQGSARRRVEPAERWLLAFCAAMLALWVLGYSLGVVDVRFLPFLHGGLLLLAAWEAGRWIEAAGGLPRRRGRIAPAALKPGLVAAAIVAVAVHAVAQVDVLPAWVRWNFSGMERMTRWPDYRGAMEAIAGDVGQPRVAWEHHPEHNAAGTIRAFELLPYFSGRATLEGLYLQSAPLAPAVFYVQSETSLKPSCPLTAYECRTFDPEAALPHLRLLGAGSMIAYTDSLKAALGRLPGVQERARSGVYTVFDLPPVELVEPARYRPVQDAAPEWRREAYDWLRASTDLDVPLVLAAGAAGDRARPATRDGQAADAAAPARARVDRYRPGALPREPYGSLPEVSYEVHPRDVRIRTSRPGHPLLVKVAYHPGWRASDGSPVELAAPGMMLVTPRSTSLLLEWGTGGAGVAGKALTAGTLLLFGLWGLRRRAPAWRPPEGGVREGRVVVALLLAGAAAAGAAALLRHPRLDYAALLAEGRAALADGRFAEAEGAFRRMLAGETAHPLRDDAAFYLALTPTEAGRVEEARTRWEDFLETVPVSTYRTEALLRLARLYEAGGEPERAARALAEAVAAPLAPSHWRQAARDELARLGEEAPTAVSAADRRARTTDAPRLSQALNAIAPPARPTPSAAPASTSEG
jgi:tetratricopeptide (TPR) repeat protein